MAGVSRFWHVEYTDQNGKVVVSINHRTKIDAIKYVEIEGAKPSRLFWTATKEGRPQAPR